MRSQTIRRAASSFVLNAIFLAFLPGAASPVSLIAQTSGARPQPPLRPQAVPQSGAFTTPLTDAAIDDAVVAEWFGGAEHPLANPSLVHSILWTITTPSSASRPLLFGISKQPGARHLRVAFKSPVAVGTVLVRGGGLLSILRPNATYPGNLADESQWIPAQLVQAQPAQPQTALISVNPQTGTAEVGSDSYALWVLPPGTRTRALRFTHTPDQTDRDYSGSLGGLYILGTRFLNLAPQSDVRTSSNSNAAPLLVDSLMNGWHTWDNGPTYDHPVNAQHPEWIILSWPQTVSLSGVAALWAGFNEANVEVFTGTANLAVEDAPESSWRAVGKPWQLRNQYPVPLGVDWLDFGGTVQTRAVRIRLTQVTDESRHPHLTGKTQNGKRVWLGELMALSPLGAAPLPSTQKIAALQTQQSATLNPPIPVRFTLPAEAYVSLVIDDAQGNRVRNLVSDTLFPAGANTVWWDGSNDLLRDPDAAAHGIYFIPKQFVAPGRYTVRGIAHQPLALHYEFSVYSPGNPPWETLDGTGGWLTNHTPPSSTLFVPADKAPDGKPLIYLGCWLGEGGSALAWVDLDGNKKGGRATVGGNWTGAQALARDAGPRADKDVYAYTAAAFRDAPPPGQKMSFSDVGVRLNGLTSHGDKAVLNYRFRLNQEFATQDAANAMLQPQVGGLAVYNNLLVLSMTMRNQLLFVDAAAGKVLGTASIDSPHGIAFDASGELLVLSGKRLLRYHLPVPHPENEQVTLPKPEVVIADNLQAPSGLTIDTDGNIYISDQAESNQVKAFSAAGKLIHTIGHPGPSQAGPYDALHMNHPRGIAVDSNHHLWVAEEDFQPKRVSEWTLDGQLVKAFYGPPEYGGGGSIDGKDKTLFYYNGMQFKLDWTSGTSALTSVLYRYDANEFQLPRFGNPESAVYADGHRYFENSYLANPLNGVGVATIYLDTGNIIHPVAALGRVSDWSIFTDSRFRSALPPNTDPASRQAKDQTMFSWSDKNNDGKVDPEEVTFSKATSGSITVMPDLALVDSFVDGKAMRYAPVEFTASGVPVYDLQHGQLLVNGAQTASSDGGLQALYSPAQTVLTTAPAPFSRDGLGGVDSAGHKWSYPSLWPGLHASHAAPRADFPGELQGTTRLLGGFVHPSGTDAGPLWGINSNFGEMYLFTADGLYVTQMLQDVRVGKPWSVPASKRNMLVNDLTPHDENFYPSITQTADGNVYFVDGREVAIVRVDGLNTIHRLPATTLDITKDDIAKASLYLKQNEAARQSKLGSQTLQVDLRSGTTPSLDEAWNKLSSAQWATIDQRITQVGWNSNPDVVKGALTVAGGRLFVGFRTSDPKLLANSGAMANAPFKTGGALDLMIGTNPKADPKRVAPVPGDLRLLVYQVEGKTKAMLYRAVVPGTANPVAFSSPSRTITLDRVEDVSSQVNLEAKSGSDAGTYVFSIPLETLGLKPVAGDKIKADIGILRGDSVQTLQRVYWNNKATGITSDVPSEAELTPNLWGDWIFEAAQ